AVRDKFSIVKQARAENRRLALPWQPPAYTKPAMEPTHPGSPAVQNRVLIPAHSEWLYLTTDHPQGRDWTRDGFDLTQWPVAQAGFGFGDSPFVTLLERVPGQAPRVYLRHEFQVNQADAVTELGLIINYSDGFIVYVNGYEVARVNVTRSSGSH